MLNDKIQITEDNNTMSKIKKIIEIYSKINCKNLANNSCINYLEDSMIIKDKNDKKMIKNWIVQIMKLLLNYYIGLLGMVTLMKLFILNAMKLRILPLSKLMMEIL